MLLISWLIIFKSKWQKCLSTKFHDTVVINLNLYNDKLYLWKEYNNQIQFRAYFSNNIQKFTWMGI